jgi:hypothetical protein
MPWEKKLGMGAGVCILVFTAVTVACVVAVEAGSSDPWVLFSGRRT